MSLIIVMLQAEVNGYRYLLGALNSVYYSIVYFSFGMYAGAANAFFVSFPLQLITFFNRKKHSYGNSVILKKCHPK